jgi:hypothetical protein
LFLDNRFRLFLEEVTEPGNMAVVTYEFACFLEQAYLGDLKTILKELDGKRSKEAEQSSVSPRIPGEEEAGEEIPQDSSREEELEMIKTLLAKAELKQALDRLQEILRESGDEKLANDGILLLSRYNRVEKQNVQGLIYPEAYEMEVNKLNMAVLNLVSDLKF